MHKTPIACVRPAETRDAEAILRLAETAGSGLTTLPADSSVIAEKLAANEEALRTHEGTILLVLESEDGVIGTGAVVTRLGLQEPFFSYKVSHHKRRSELTGQCVTSQVLELVTDFVGDAEVGSLFVSPRRPKVRVRTFDRPRQISLHRSPSHLVP